MKDLLQEFIINTAIYPDAVVESQRCIERKSLEIRVGIDVNFTVFAIGNELSDGNLAFDVDDRHVALHGGSVQCGCCCLSPALTRLVPGRGADGVALR